MLMGTSIAAALVSSQAVCSLAAQLVTLTPTVLNRPFCLAQITIANQPKFSSPHGTHLLSPDVTAFNDRSIFTRRGSRYIESIDAQLSMAE